MSVVRAAGVPSSSAQMEPRASPIVPSSTTVTPGDATRMPILPVKAEVLFLMKSPSSPWPTASWSRMPGQPGPSTTGMMPAGAGAAPRLWIASETASRAHLRMRSRVKNSSPARAPPPAEARSRLPFSEAMTEIER